MLFEAMPLSLRSSDKRKNAHCHEDLPFSKKIALDHQMVGEYGQSRAGAMKFSTDPSEELILSESPSHHQIAASSREMIPSRNIDAKLALHLSSDESDGKVWSSTRHENGMSSKHMSGEDQISLRPSQMLTDEGREDDSIDVDEQGTSDSDAQGNSEIGSHSMKQPSLILKDLKKNKEKQKVTQDRISADKYVVGSPCKSVLEGGYMRRMASLNASACVSALMEPEKKPRPHKSLLSKPTKISSDEAKLRQQKRETRKSWSLSSSDDTSPLMPPLMGLENRKESQGMSPGRFYGSSTSPSDADTSKDSEDILDVSGPQIYTLLALASLANCASYDVDEIPYNKLGLLYNGDTVHPAARVFYTSDVDLTLPERIIPRVVPSREQFVRDAVSKSVAQRSVGKKKKGAKVSVGIACLKV